MDEKERLEDAKKARRDSVRTGVIVVLLSVLIIGGMVLATLSL